MSRSKRQPDQQPAAIVRAFFPIHSQADSYALDILTTTVNREPPPVSLPDGTPVELQLVAQQPHPTIGDLVCNDSSDKLFAHYDDTQRLGPAHTCRCNRLANALPPGTYQLGQLGHLIVPNLNQLPASRFPNLARALSFSLTTRPQPSENYSVAATTTSILRFIDTITFSTTQHVWDEPTLSLWRSAITTSAMARIRKLPESPPRNRPPPYSTWERELSEIHSALTILRADRDGTNGIGVCTRLLQQTQMDAMLSSGTHINLGRVDPTSLIDNLVTKMEEALGTKFPDRRCLPLPGTRVTAKTHKENTAQGTPKLRVITCASNHPLSPATDALSIALKTIHADQIQRHHDADGFTDREVKNSVDLAAQLPDEVYGVISADVSGMFDKFEHPTLLPLIHDAITKAFQGHQRDVIVLDYKDKTGKWMARPPLHRPSPHVIDEPTLHALADLCLLNSFINIGGQILKQVRGVPQGYSCSPITSSIASTEIEHNAHLLLKEEFDFYHFNINENYFRFADDSLYLDTVPRRRSDLRRVVTGIFVPLYRKLGLQLNLEATPGCRNAKFLSFEFDCPLPTQARTGYCYKTKHYARRLELFPTTTWLLPHPAGLTLESVQTTSLVGHIVGAYRTTTMAEDFATRLRLYRSLALRQGFSATFFERALRKFFRRLPQPNRYRMSYEDIVALI